MVFQLTLGCRVALLVALLSLAAWAQPGQSPPGLIPAEQIDSIRERQDPFFLDVRTPAEIEELGKLPDSYNIPVDELEQRLEELPKDRPILTA